MLIAAISPDGWRFIRAEVAVLAVLLLGLVGWWLTRDDDR